VGVVINGVDLGFLDDVIGPWATNSRVNFSFLKKN